MRSDWDDAPEYLRNRKKPSPWRFLTILGIGSAVLSALALTFGKPVALDVNQIKQGIHVGGKPWFNQEPAQPMQPVGQPSVATYEAPAAEPTPAPQQRQLSQEEIEWFEKRTAEAVQSRQTSFNDNNYTPRPVANTMQPTTGPLLRSQLHQQHAKTLRFQTDSPQQLELGERPQQTAHQRPV